MNAIAAYSLGYLYNSPSDRSMSTANVFDFRESDSDCVKRIMIRIQHLALHMYGYRYIFKLQSSIIYLDEYEVS